jgi:hypothetical protein
MNHWMHECPAEDVFVLSNRMYRFLRWHDGCDVLLADKSEAGWKYINERGTDSTMGTPAGEYIPEHVHFDYLNTKAYAQSRTERGVEGASHGEFLPRGEWSRERKDNN